MEFPAGSREKLLRHVMARERVVAEHDSLLVPGHVLDFINRHQQHPSSQAADRDLE